MKLVNLCKKARTFELRNFGKTSKLKNVSIRALPESGVGVYPCPNFWTPFFDQLIVPKKVIFYPKLTIFVGFSVFFVIIIIKITKILIKIIMATIIITIRAKRRFCRKKSVKLPELGGGGFG